MKNAKRIGAILCALILLFTAAMPAFADADAENTETASSAEPVEARTLYISTAQELSDFAAACTLDGYSENLTVYLENDIDLTDLDFSPIPYFAGVFYGDQYTVYGLTLDGDGSHMGLFRTVAAGAQIFDLNVAGTVTPGGTGCMVGGIAGENNGSLIRCSFTGTVSGVEQIGGIAGLNGETGVISGCDTNGDVTGEHRVGGIVGKNSGTVSGCSSASSVNTVEIEDASTVTLDVSNLLANTNLLADTAAEEVLDITDIGGIAGYNDGTLYTCVALGDVGYGRIGYNVGGVCGRSCGIVSNCVNNGTVQGRRDVGGILGQLEPDSNWDFSHDKLAEIRDALQETEDQINTAIDNLGDSGDAAKAQLSSLSSSVSGAIYDIESLLGETETNIETVESTLTQAAGLVQQAIDETENGDALNGIRDGLQQIQDSLTQDDGIIQGTGSLNIDQDDGVSASAGVSAGAASGEISYESGSGVSVSASIQPQITALLNSLDQLVSGTLDNGLVGEMSDLISGMNLSDPDFTDFYNDFSAILGSVQGLGSAVSGLGQTAADSVESIMSTLNGLSDTFFTTVDNVATISTDYQEDISAYTTEDLTAGVASGCRNYGSVSADENVGGVVGSIAWELDFDVAGELNLSQYLLTDAKYLICAVVSDCTDQGSATARDGSVGGIVGSMDFGAVLDSVCTAAITANSGDGVGGIVGVCGGTILRCDARASLTGGAYVGGITGQGGTVTDCTAYTEILSADEYVGAIAGSADNVSGCRYVDTGIGAVDGVSYSETAAPISYDDLAADPDVPDELRGLTVTFMMDGKVYETVDVPFGGSIDELPEVPNAGTKYWKWDEFVTENIEYDQTVSGAWYDPRTSIDSGEQPATFVIDGSFYEDQILTVGEYSPQPGADGLPETPVMAAYKLSVNDAGSTLTVRFRSEKDGELYITGADGGEYTACEYTRDGSYIVFTMDNGGRFALFETLQSVIRGWMVATGSGILAAIVAAVVIILLLRHRRKRRQAARDAKKDAEAAENRQSADPAQTPDPAAEPAIPTETPDGPDGTDA